MAQNAASRSAQSGPLNARRKSAAVTPGAITTLATVNVDFVLAEAAVGDIATVSLDAAPEPGLLVGAPYIAVAGHVRIPFLNITGSTVTQGAITANVGIAKTL